MGKITNCDGRGPKSRKKCTFTIHDMEVGAKGRWKYKDEEKKKRRGSAETDEDELEELDPFEEVSMGVPMVNGDLKAIKQLKSSEAVKNLGLFARPDGDSSPHMEQLRGRLKN